MDDLTVPVQVVESNKDLFGHAANNRNRNPLVIVPLHDFKKVHPEDFENHYEMRTVCPRVQERIQELDSMAVLDRNLSFIRQVFVAKDVTNPLLVESVFTALFQNFNFVVGGLLVVAR